MKTQLSPDPELSSNHDTQLSNKVEQAKEKKKSQIDALVRLTSGIKIFLNQTKEAHAVIEQNGYKSIQKIESKAFERWLMMLFFSKNNTPPSPEALKQVVRVLEMKAYFEGDVHPLHLRIAQQEGTIYYDIASGNGSVVAIKKDGYTINTNPPILFYRTPNTKAQALPLPGGKLSDILKHIRLKNKMDELLFMVYIVTCFIPGIPHPALIISGEKGAAKTTTARMIRSIVDPAIQDTTFLPSGTADLALSLSKNYMLSLDNLDSLTAEKSDLLCTAVTGGSISKRKLFTDDEEIMLSFKRCIVINGINIAASRSDFLDRSILMELERIKETERKEESVLWEEFEKSKPLILGAIYDLLSKAMHIYPQVILPELYRMADFTRWGYAVAKAAGMESLFLQAYKENMELLNNEAVDSHPVASAICALMKKQSAWHGTVADLLDTLETIAFRERINIRVHTWPKAAQVLSIRLKEVKSNLEKKGIYFEIRNGGTAKFVTIDKQSDDNCNE